MNDPFSKLEEKYWNFRNSFSIYNSIKPTNLIEEKEKFLKCFHNNEIYNPIFHYQGESNIDKISTLESFLKEFIKYDHILSSFYIELIHDTITWIINFKKRGEEFEQWLLNVHGLPNKNAYSFAINNLKKIIPYTEGNSISSSEVVEFFNKKLTELNFKKWKAIEDRNTFKIAVVRSQKTIKISSKINYDEGELERLLIHEIMTHVWRSENAKFQKSPLFLHGFPSYMTTEEGLAILNEMKLDLCPPSQFQKYCLRLIGAWMLQDYGFWDVFSFAVKYLDEYSAFDFTSRLKRGLIDTSVPGGFSKDHIYLSGYLDLQELDINSLKLLYIGKVGIQHLNLILNNLSYFNLKFKSPDWY